MVWDLSDGKKTGLRYVAAMLRMTDENTHKKLGLVLYSFGTFDNLVGYKYGKLINI